MFRKANQTNKTDKIKPTDNKNIAEKCVRHLTSHSSWGCDQYHPYRSSYGNQELLDLRALRLKVQGTAAQLNLVAVSRFAEFAPSRYRYCSAYLRCSVRLQEWAQ